MLITIKNDLTLGMPIMKKILWLVCLTSCFSTSASAKDTLFLEAYLGGGGYSLDNDRGLKSMLSKEGGVEMPLNTFLSLESWLSAYDAEYEKTSDELDSKRFYAGALLHLKRRGKSRPFISAGLSHLAYENTTGKDKTESLINIAMGAKRYYSNNLILRWELMMMNSVDKELIDIGARLAIGYAFKDHPVAPVLTPEPEPEPEPEPVKAPEPVVKKVVKEKPPEPIDSDKDGVVDSIDQCPGTNPEFKVDTTGCPVMLTETVSITLDIKFQFNSAELSVESLPEIQKVADFMKRFEQTVLTVEGHSDDSGPAVYNKALSQQRADAVKHALINTFYLASERVSATGFGEEKPIADNTTKAGRAINRRVVAVLESSIQKAVVRDTSEAVALK